MSPSLTCDVGNIDRDKIGLGYGLLDGIAGERLHTVTFSSAYGLQPQGHRTRSADQFEGVGRQAGRHRRLLDSVPILDHHA